MASTIEVGNIPVFQLTERNPSEMRAHPENDLFIVYGSNGNPRMCRWMDGAFWYRWGETDADWDVVLDVQYWFRVPKAEEIVNGHDI